MDSLYKGYPTGYLIISKSPDLKLKDGSLSVGKKIMIDGQQRVTAMMTALSGLEVFNADFNKKHIAIAYNPFAKKDEECFAVQDNAILKDKKWIPDISVIFQTSFDSFSFVQNFCEINPEITPKDFNQQITKLIDIKNRKLGVIELFDKELSIDEVTEIFIRINSQGTKLNQADFAMSRIAANETYGGNMLRKAIDYFSHLAVDPKWYPEMIKDEEFAKTDYAPKLKWLKDDNDDIYDPDYSDMLRVAFMSQYPRGKMKDLVSLLQGRDFETKDFKESIAEETFKNLSNGVLDYMNEYNFKQFVLAIKDAGFISKKLELFNAYCNSLILLKDNNLHSISFSLISSGVFAGVLPKPAGESEKQCGRAYKKFVQDYPNYEVDVMLSAFYQKEFQNALKYLKIVQFYSHDVECLLSGDYGDDSFLENIKDELEELEKNPDIIEPQLKKCPLCKYFNGKKCTNHWQMDVINCHKLKLSSLGR